MKYKTFPLTSFKALADQPEGTFEAIVAVFNNVDRIGDKIIPGAFKDSLANWKAKGRPIPVIFAHEWDNLDAHIGQVLDAKEMDPGLYVKGQLEMDEPFAARVWKKMMNGTLAEFSFAYDVVDAVQAKVNGEYVNELRKLELLEVGPCLVGMNPETQLLGVKVGLKPFPNEHACRLRDPGDFEADSFRRTTRRHEGKEYAVIMARLKGEDSLTEQAYRYPKDDWSVSDARSHCRAHDGSFEAAAEKEGRRNSTKDQARVQAIHDAACELGAKCASAEGDAEDEAGDGKSSGQPSTLAARVAIELLELGID